MQTFEERLLAVLETDKFEFLDEKIPHSYGTFAEELLDQADENSTEIDFRLDHEMSGYGGAFNAMDVSIKLEELSENEYKVTTKLKAFGGELTKSMQRENDDGDLDWDDVWEDYDDLTTWSDEETVCEETFPSLKEALEDIDNTCGPYEG